jgi:hypothetical protein
MNKHRSNAIKGLVFLFVFVLSPIFGLVLLFVHSLFPADFFKNEEKD